MENVFVMAGVPMIMRAMLEDIEPRLQRGALVHAQTVQARIGEGKIAAGLQTIQKNFPDLAIGSYPYYREDGFGVQLVARGRDAEQVEKGGTGHRIANPQRRRGTSAHFDLNSFR